MSVTPHLSLPLQENWTTDLVVDWAKPINDAANTNNAFSIIDTAIYQRAIKPSVFTANHIIGINASGALIDLGISNDSLVHKTGDENVVGWKHFANLTVNAPTSNLQAANKSYVDTKQSIILQRTVTILSTEWDSELKCTKTVQGVTATNIIIVEPDSQYVECIAQDTNSLTFSTSQALTETVTIKVVVIP